MKPAITLPGTNNSNAPALAIIKIAALLAVILLTLTLKGSCADSTRTAKNRNTVYASLTTQDNTPTLHYERTFRQGHLFSYSISAGFGAKGRNVSVPLSINAITTGGQHHLELGLGVVPYVAEHISAKGRRDLDKQVYVRPAIGYRFQQPTGGVFVKASVGPQLLIDPPAYNVAAASFTLVKPAAQLALGISF
jgi:hypothetical protein